jgi:predicted RNA binding protein YcfA (HicA-like mRNA interferase family)
MASVKAKRVLAALLRHGWEIKRSSGSHRILRKAGYPDFVFTFHSLARAEVAEILEDSPNLRPTAADAIKRALTP